MVFSYETRELVVKDLVFRYISSDVIACLQDNKLIAVINIKWLKADKPSSMNAILMEKIISIAAFYTNLIDREEISKFIEKGYNEDVG